MKHSHPHFLLPQLDVRPEEVELGEVRQRTIIWSLEEDRGRRLWERNSPSYIVGLEGSQDKDAKGSSHT